MDENFEITGEHLRWAKSAKRKYHKSIGFWTDLIQRQAGKCALTKACLLFDLVSGTPQAGRQGCHPLYASVDHISPGQTELGFQILCCDINDLKGYLPTPLFNALIKTKEWKHFADEWKGLADSSSDRMVFKNLIKTGKA